MKTSGNVKAKEFVIFKAGTWNGETFTEQDLDNMVKNYNADEPPHIIIGHSSDYKGKTRIPSFGSVLGGLKRVGKDLIAVGAEFNEKLAEWIKEGFYGQRSVEMSRDNKRILAIGMLGATPPAVKGLPIMDSDLMEIAMEYSQKDKKSKIIEFQDEEIEENGAEELTEPITVLGEIEELAIEDTLKSVSECCGRFLSVAEEILKAEETDDERLVNEIFVLQGDLMEELSLHSKFKEKIEQMEESEAEFDEQLGGWKEFKNVVKQLFTKRKESIVNAQQEKEYKEKILVLETEVGTLTAKAKEFSEKEEALKAEALLAEQKSKDDALKAEIKVFCDATVTSGKMTPAMREKDEPIMFILGSTSPDSLKSFQEKYTAIVVPLGEVTELNSSGNNDKRPQVIKDAEQYVKDHAKEFTGLSAVDAINRAVYLHSRGRIKFEGKK